MTLSLRPERLNLEPDTSNNADAYSSEYAPLLLSSRTLARFEFEAGRGNEGTKILMVQWSDDDQGSDWEISWDGKTTVLPAKEVVEDKLLRIYFLLAPGSSIPRVVNISRPGKEDRRMQTNPLPAIFPPELGATAEGRKGVLHTLWAKKRLSVLQKEIEQEMKNGEGVGLEMALQERQWIHNNFGVVPKATHDVSQAAPTRSPQSPSKMRFSEKLKGLKVKTTGSQLSASARSDFESVQGACSSQSISPDSSDVAVSSFSLFQSPRSTGSRNQYQNSATRKGNCVVTSMDAILNDQFPAKGETEIEDELFAVKLSPRSPEMTRSPFSLVGTIE
ncbi:hypothetical protein K3495_g8561 [Podosphaera aphanis]|nr:hypothetical protein K3495_g8561 [Podosphaera aphanis]